MKNSACTRRWNYFVFDVSIGRLKTCCFVPFPPQPRNLKEDLEYIHQRRLEMLAGQRHSDCQKCWGLEDRGVRSQREYSPHFETVLDPEKTARLQRPDRVEIMLGNVCDMKCQYCFGFASAQWAKQTGERIRHPKAKYVEETLDFLEAHWSSIRYIHITGGEPSLIPEFYEILERLWLVAKANASATSPRKTLVIISNFNAGEIIFEKLLTHLKVTSQHFDVHLSPSFEAIGAVAEEIRTGLQWGNLNRNLDKILEAKIQGIQIWIQAAHNALSVPHLEGFFSYIIGKIQRFRVPIYLVWNIVESPTHLNPLTLPPETAEVLARTRAAIAGFLSLNILNDELLQLNWSTYKRRLGDLEDAFRNQLTAVRPLE